MRLLISLLVAVALLEEGCRLHATASPLSQGDILEAAGLNYTTAGQASFTAATWDAPTATYYVARDCALAVYAASPEGVVSSSSPSWLRAGTNGLCVDRVAGAPVPPVGSDTDPLTTNSTALDILVLRAPPVDGASPAPIATTLPPGVTPPPAGQATLAPVDVSASVLFELFVADFGRIRRFNFATSVLENFAGQWWTSATPTPAEGAGTAATFSKSLVFASVPPVFRSVTATMAASIVRLSNLYVLDTDWNCIRKVGLASATSNTFAGLCETSVSGVFTFSSTAQGTVSSLSVRFSFPLTASAVFQQVETDSVTLAVTVVESLFVGDNGGLYVITPAVCKFIYSKEVGLTYGAMLGMVDTASGRLVMLYARKDDACLISVVTPDIDLAAYSRAPGSPPTAHVPSSVTVSIVTTAASLNSAPSCGGTFYGFTHDMAARPVQPFIDDPALQWIYLINQQGPNQVHRVTVAGLSLPPYVIANSGTATGSSTTSSSSTVSSIINTTTTSAATSSNATGVIAQPTATSTITTGVSTTAGTNTSSSTITSFGSTPAASGVSTTAGTTTTAASSSGNSTSAPRQSNPGNASADDSVAPSGPSATVIAAAVGGSLAGLLLIVLVAAAIIFVVRKKKKRTMSSERRHAYEAGDVELHPPQAATDAAPSNASAPVPPKVVAGLCGSASAESRLLPSATTTPGLMQSVNVADELNGKPPRIDGASGATPETEPDGPVAAGGQTEDGLASQATGTTASSFFERGDDASPVVLERQPTSSPNRQSDFIEGSTVVPASEDAIHRQRCEMVKRGVFQRGKLLGRGANGSVFSCILPDGTTIAVKHTALSGDDASMREQASLALKEAQMLTTLQHPNVVAVYGIAFNKRDMIVETYMELMPSGSLGSLVRGLDGRLGESVCRQYVTSVTRGLAFLHRHGVVHRDLKCDNVLLDGPSGRVKIADFGTARRVGHSQSQMANTIVGTPYFMAPEVIAGGSAPEGEVDSTNGYGTAADVWSLGILAAEMLDCGKPPWPTFANPSLLFMHIYSAEGIPVVPTGVSEQAADFIRICTKRDPSLRPSAADLLQHAWLNPLRASATATGPSTMAAPKIHGSVQL